MSFVAPTEGSKRAAVGALADVRVEQRAFFDIGGFQSMTVPGPQDWLANQAEPGQTFSQFMQSRPKVPQPPRTRVYFQPIGDFWEGAPRLSILKDWADAFFAMPVQMLAPVSAKSMSVTTRVSEMTHHPQLLTMDILAQLRRQLPADAFCLLGITFADLYPDPKWSYVFGQASLQERVGVYSFARFDPAFYGEKDASRSQTILKRSCKIPAHETGHMFRIQHCIYFRCVMNGSNHMAEADSRPFHLCPVDLHKLHASVGFDVVERYAHVEEFCRAHGLSEESDWIGKQLTSAHKQQ